MVTSKGTRMRAPLDNIHGDELGVKGRGVIGTMDQEDIPVCVCIWGTRELHHLGEKDRLQVFVSIENVTPGKMVES
jgi:hypothetical protein